MATINTESPRLRIQTPSIPAKGRASIGTEQTQAVQTELETAGISILVVATVGFCGAISPGLAKI